MTILTRFIHSIKGWHYYRMAARRRRDLTEYVLGEETRIKVLLHRAAWHFNHSKALDQPAMHETDTPALLAPTKSNERQLSSPPSLNGAGRMFHQVH